MTLYSQIKNSILNSLTKLQAKEILPEFDLDEINFNISQPNIPEKFNPNNIFYHYSTNIAFTLAKSLKTNPIELAKNIQSELLQEDLYERVDFMAPGFINLVVKDIYFNNAIYEIIKLKNNFGKFKANNQKINIEYVSANPTGFLHVGHVRGAVVGKVIYNVLKFAGYSVEGEYYVNNAGNQINLLARSVLYWYLKLHKISSPKVEDGYNGKDILLCAKKIKKVFGNKFIKLKESHKLFADFKKFSYEILFEEILKDLWKLKISFDSVFYESSLYENSDIEKVLEKLKNKTYQDGNSLVLKTSEYGDDKDRVLVKSDKSFTYFLPDIAYHYLKFKKADKLINIWGADHLGYIQRIKAAMHFLNLNDSNLDILTLQLVRLIKNGQEFKMSKRKGTSVTLKDLLKVSNKDSIFFGMLLRDSNSKYDFDIDKNNASDINNPVYIVKYSYSRAHSLSQNLAKYQKTKEAFLSDKAKKLVLELDFFQELISVITKTLKPNLLTQYLINLANLFNSFYSEKKIKDTSKEKHYSGLIQAYKIVLSNALKLLNIKPPKKM
ncbi:arginine--tRNA ligase [Mycoplasmopsis synoviae]|uniref:arginine--tRNA ligase n=1 Tax=Mycoplasmopsis synoviae TaxID=2109 RepID=UPI000CA3CA5F|nr:arginine--tRNA ligase [Mycoplasmopsis synoviae]AKJ20577.1 Arginyl-tRNA synthetase [Mycoplasmopsis synoviae]AQU47897.1 Arginyl-tRNA synthetase [Mycoplasmopsis synoviae]AWL84144.1 arginine--tRNA ligase [Mycoplasmopsis synoviae]QLE13865.1 arginine--tRNA ligase [Mycoplasmopsis synoviae]UZF63991.1 arginine--tRNA ligase [Mycoplasmopsis synoviae]